MRINLVLDWLQFQGYTKRRQIIQGVLNQYYFYYMKTLSVLEARKTIDSLLDDSFVTSKKSSTIDVRDQIKIKYKTANRWNYKQYIKNKKKKQLAKSDSPQQTDNANMLSILMKYTQDLKKKQQQKSKVKLVVEELDGVKAQRRERFKKSTNPLFIVQHYMKKQNYKPTEEEDYIIQKIIKLKEKIDFMHPLDLDFALNQIYKIMNTAVDFNSLRFLVLIIILAAQICFQAKEMNRAFYFYEQARIASTFADLDTSKLQCLMQMGRIALEIQMTDQTIKLFKKSLQYAWKLKDTETQLKIYDFLGQIYYYEGSLRIAQYYHNRFIQGQIQRGNSAIKRISHEMLNQYEKKIKVNCQKINLSQLFIQYLDLPISNFNFYPMAKLKEKKDYQNYKKGESPRKNRQEKSFSGSEFPSVQNQILKLFQNEEEFTSEIPNPDLQRNFIAEQKFGRTRKNLPFERSIHYHKIVGIEAPSLHNEKEYKLPIGQKIQKHLSETINPNWWQDMIFKMKKKKEEKVGKLKDKIRKGHLSYHKYPEEKRRASSLKATKIKQSINKTLLNWIDPIK